MKFILFFLFILTMEANAQSWNPMCPGTSSRWVNGFLMKMTEADEHPYAEACEPTSFETGEFLTAKSNKEKMPLHVFINELPKKTKSGKNIKPFFADIKKEFKIK